MTEWTDEQCLRFSEGYDREDAAQRGEASPHCEGPEYAEWAAERIACVREGLAALAAPEPLASWRDLRLGDIDWRVYGWRGLRKSALRDYTCRVTGRRYKGDLSDMTLGQLADAGERFWRYELSCGPVGAGYMKALIDRAAGGVDLRKGGFAPDAYVPRAEREAQR